MMRGIAEVRTGRPLAAIVEAIEPALSDEQKRRVTQFIFNLVDVDSEERTDAMRNRNDLERAFEEAQLTGRELARRQREPA